jgi:hypothetical protein
MAITSYAGAISDVVWTTDKARVTTGVNAVTFQVALAGKPTLDGNDFLYNDGTVTNSIPLVIPANSSIDLYVGVGNQVTTTGANGSCTEIGTASSANAGVYN